MPSQLAYPSVVTKGATGDSAWSSAGAPILGAPDSSFDFVTLPPANVSDELIFTGMGFAIPAGQYIRGVSLDFYCHSDVSGVFASTLKLVIAGAATGSNRGDPATLFTIDPGFPGTNGPTRFGSATDRWGCTLTRAIVNASDFGFTFIGAGVNNSANFSFDAVGMTVTYSPAAGGAFLLLNRRRL